MVSMPSSRGAQAIATIDDAISSMLNSLVKGLNRAPELADGLRALGRRHHGYQATVAHYKKRSR